MAKNKRSRLKNFKTDILANKITLEKLKSWLNKKRNYSATRRVIEEDALYQQLLPKLEAQLKGDLENEPDWDKLIEDDPYTYVRQKQIWDDKKRN